MPEEINSIDQLPYDAVTDLIREFAEENGLDDIAEMPEKDLILFLGEEFPIFGEVSPKFAEAYDTVSSWEYEKATGRDLTAERAKAAASKRRRAAAANIPGPIRFAAREALRGARAGSSIVEQFGAWKQALPAVADPMNVLPQIAGRKILEGMGKPAPKGPTLTEQIGQTIREQAVKASEATTTGMQDLGESAPVVEFAGMIRETAISSMPSYVAAFLGGLPAAGIVGGMQSYGSMWSEVYDDLTDKGEPEESARRKAGQAAAIAGVTTAALTRLFGGVERMIGKGGKFFRENGVREVFEKGLKGAIKDIGKSAMLETIEEGLDEFLQGLTQDLFTDKGILSDSQETRRKAWRFILKKASMAAMTAPFLAGAATVGTRSIAGRTVESNRTKARAGAEDLQFKIAGMREALNFLADEQGATQLNQALEAIEEENGKIVDESFNIDESGAEELRTRLSSLDDRVDEIGVRIDEIAGINPPPEENNFRDRDARNLARAAQKPEEMKRLIQERSRSRQKPPPLPPEVLRGTPTDTGEFFGPIQPALATPERSVRPQEAADKIRERSGFTEVTPAQPALPTPSAGIPPAGPGTPQFYAGGRLVRTGGQVYEILSEVDPSLYDVRNVVTGTEGFLGKKVTDIENVAPEDVGIQQGFRAIPEFVWVPSTPGIPGVKGRWVLKVDPTRQSEPVSHEEAPTAPVPKAPQPPAKAPEAPEGAETPEPPRKRQEGELEEYPTPLTAKVRRRFKVTPSARRGGIAPHIAVITEKGQARGVVPGEPEAPPLNAENLKALLMSRLRPRTVASPEERAQMRQEQAAEQQAAARRQAPPTTEEEVLAELRDIKARGKVQGGFLEQEAGAAAPIDQFKQKIVRALQTGATHEQIAQVFGISPDRVAEIDAEFKRLVDKAKAPSKREAKRQRQTAKQVRKANEKRLAELEPELERVEKILNTAIAEDPNNALGLAGKLIERVNALESEIAALREGIPEEKAPAPARPRQKPSREPTGDLTEMSDKELAGHAKAGSRNAFDELVRRSQTSLRAVVHKMTGNNEDTSDVVQDAMLTAWNAIGRFKGDSSFSTWLHRIALNRAARLLKQKNRMAGPSLDEEGVSEMTPELVTSLTTTPAEAAAAKEEQVEAAKLISRLPQDLRAVTALFDIQGLSHAQIASITGEPEGTVRSKLHRARKLLESMRTKEEMAKAPAKQAESKTVELETMDTEQERMELAALRKQANDLRNQLVTAAQELQRRPKSELAKENFDRLKAELEKLQARIAKKAVRVVTIAGPPGTATVQKAAESVWKKVKEGWARYREDPVHPVVQFDDTHLLPNLQDRETSAEVFSKPHGWATAPVGAELTSPLTGRKIKTQPALIAPILRWYAEHEGVARAVKGAVNANLSWARKPFDINSEGDITNITVPEGKSSKIQDVFSAVLRGDEGYVLNDEQMTALDGMMAYIEDARRLAKHHGVDIFVDDEGEGSLSQDVDASDYFPRIVRIFPQPTMAGKAGGGKRPGGKPFYGQTRIFNSEQMGWEAGYVYELDPVARVADLAERVYKKIADNRLITDPNLGSFEEMQKQKAYASQLQSEVRGGSLTPRQAGAAMASFKARRTVPGFVDKIPNAAPQDTQLLFPPEVTEVLRAEFPATASQFRTKIARANSLVKGLLLGLDFGVPLIQLQYLAASNPGIWKDATTSMFKAFADPEYLNAYIMQNQDAVRKLIQLGSTVGRLPEMVAGLESGANIWDIQEWSRRKGKELAERNKTIASWVARTPGMTMDAFARSFMGAIDVAKIELFKAWEPHTKPEEMFEMVRGIESLTNMGRMESEGLHTSRALLERVLLLAPSYYRGALNLVANLGRKGIAGRMARQTMGRFAAANMMIYWAAGLMSGMDPDDLLERMSPTNSRFMMVDFPLPDGRVLPVGLGGVVRSMLRLMANTVKTAAELKFSNFGMLSADKNPFMRWLRGHSAPVPSMLWSGLSGRDYLGQEAGVGRIFGQTVIPLAPQVGINALIDHYKEGKDVSLSGTLAEGIFTFMGMNAYPESFSAARNRRMNEIAKEKYNKRYEDLNATQMGRVWGDIEDDQIVNAAKAEELSPGFMEYLAEIKQEQQKRLMKALPDEARRELKRRKIKLPVPTADFKVGGQTARMTPSQAERMEDYLSEEYTKRFSRVKFGKRSDKEVEKLVENIGRSVKLIATRRLIQSINQHARQQ